MGGARGADARRRIREHGTLKHIGGLSTRGNAWERLSAAKLGWVKPTTGAIQRGCSGGRIPLVYSAWCVGVGAGGSKAAGRSPCGAQAERIRSCWRKLFSLEANRTAV